MTYIRKIICPACGQSVSDRNRYCGHCKHVVVMDRSERTRQIRRQEAEDASYRK